MRITSGEVGGVLRNWYDCRRAVEERVVDEEGWVSVYYSGW